MHDRYLSIKFRRANGLMVLVGQVLSLACHSQNADSTAVPVVPAVVDSVSSQTQVPKKSIHPARAWIIGAATTAVYGTSLISLSDAWFSGSSHSSFHYVNDNKEWLQTDKLGHAWTAYNTSRISTALWSWTGAPPKTATWFGGGSGFLYLLAIEWMDAHSKLWGWSWGDIGADIFGTSLFVSQELTWKEQRIQYKFSGHHKDYGQPLLNDRADELFGKTGFKRTLEDYNAQTYWFSANLHSFFKHSSLPPWLNIAFGLGADGMFGESENRWMDGSASPVDRTDIPRIRQFYLAPDLDFTKIPTRKKWLRTVFFALNAFKFPTPAFMINSKGKAKLYAAYF